MARKSLISALLLAGIGTCSGQAAADGPGGPYAYTPAMLFYDWSGLYVGGNVGVNNTRSEWAFTPTAEPVEQSATGFTGGGFVGLQKQFGQLVLGVEASYTFVTGDETSGSAVAPGLTLTSEVSNLFTATGKVGYAYMNYLAYVRGGYATGDVEYRSGGLLVTSSSAREHGWTAGVGVDYAITPNISLGASYDYVRLLVDDRVQTPIGAGAQVVDTSVDIQLFTARLTFKFGRPPEPVAVPIK
jgi:opacity protein-like surface antigen